MYKKTDPFYITERKMYKFQVFLDRCFLVFRLNTENYSANLLVPYEYWKKRTEKTLNLDTFTRCTFPFTDSLQEDLVFSAVLNKGRCGFFVFFAKFSFLITCFCHMRNVSFNKCTF